jgi:hypothetical protein
MHGPGAGFVDELEMALPEARFWAASARNRGESTS